MLILFMLLDFPSFTYALYISIFSTLHPPSRTYRHLLYVFEQAYHFGLRRLLRPPDSLLYLHQDLAHNKELLLAPMGKRAATTARIAEPSLRSEVFPDLVDDEVELVEATLQEASGAAELAASRGLDDFGRIHSLREVVMVFLVLLFLPLEDAISDASAEFHCW